MQKFTLFFKQVAPPRRVATCKPGKPGLTSFSETLALFFVQFLSFPKMKVQDRQNGPSKSFRAYQKKLAGYAPASSYDCGQRTCFDWSRSNFHKQLNEHVDSFALEKASFSI